MMLRRGLPTKGQQPDQLALATIWVVSAKCRECGVLPDLDTTLKAFQLCFASALNKPKVRRPSAHNRGKKKYGQTEIGKC